MCLLEKVLKNHKIHLLNVNNKQSWISPFPCIRLSVQQNLTVHLSHYTSLIPPKFQNILTKAVSEGDDSLVQHLLDKGIDVNAVNTLDKTTVS